MIFMHHGPNMSSSSVVYESDTATEERPSQPTRTRIQATFQIAHPAPKSSLRFAPKLLLQIQQLAQNHRPVPVLEIWQPPFRKSKLTRDFHQRVKLRSGDIYATLDESYMTNSTRRQNTSNTISDPESENITTAKDIIAAMCHDDTASNIHFRNARCSWQASAGTTGPNASPPCYRFTIKDDETDPADPGRMILQWEKRSKENAPAGSVDAEQFLLLLIDRKAKRKSRIATMTKSEVDIIVRKSSILDGLQVCYDLMGPLDSTGRDSSEALECWLYTMTLTLGVWVGYQEGWLN
ncbi:hypothetical protein N7448_002655 [Penicillium atrosanguineum]|uniref:Uncharacterized protein n=1 Tax=Penicillium atrosanguineum TaxID=1132637 RepID=A0A9W9HEC0_9EURO|nr:GPI mannosyltransferase 3 [Penicillium atrosanguineum]KAJ5128945.1 hypothetical protein N7526_007111 [Penicillium atrosanguineum]KAJ5145263.1 hypothetical protein N7448_002655 [Penicillium atrosanguineum]KAJ5301058.1 GPI mannosyltransferase 3 [Penicillium atrosanguineum]KAJ5311702.1 hypothetical protein N7476_007562 [Penicillium atrosanguineum]